MPVGRRLSRGDVQHAVELALKTWPDRTQQAIADQVGCSQRYVSTVQGELRTTSKLTPPATRTGADGKARPTSYEKRKQATDPDNIPGFREGAGEHEQEETVSKERLPKLGPPR